jgi:hypothetical protein
LSSIISSVGRRCERAALIPIALGNG